MKLAMIVEASSPWRKAMMGGALAGSLLGGAPQLNRAYASAPAATTQANAPTHETVNTTFLFIAKGDETQRMPYANALLMQAVNPAQFRRTNAQFFTHQKATPVWARELDQGTQLQTLQVKPLNPKVSISLVKVLSGPHKGSQGWIGTKELATSRNAAPQVQAATGEMGGEQEVAQGPEMSRYEAAKAQAVTHGPELDVPGSNGNARYEQQYAAIMAQPAGDSHNLTIDQFAAKIKKLIRKDFASGEGSYMRQPRKLIWHVMGKPDRITGYGIDKQWYWNVADGTVYVHVFNYGDGSVQTTTVGDVNDERIN